MRIFGAFLEALAFASYVFALPTKNGTDSFDSQPVFLGRFPEAVNVTDVDLQAGPFDPVNCANRVYETSRVGDGAPKDWTRWKQISLPIWCNGGQCTAGVSSSTSYTISFDALVPINRWITGGFSVSASYSTGTNHECTGSPDNGQKKVCIWAYQGHTTYTVKNINYPMDPRCGGMIESGPIRLTSPLSNNRVKGYWCGYNNDCYDQGKDDWTAGHFSG